MRKILMIGTGGTAASEETKDGRTPALKGADILDLLPEVKRICEAEPEDLFSLDSTDLQPEQWEAIAHKIEEKYEEYDGFVICHGTDTLAYGAAALSFLIQESPKPVVVTGAQIPITQAGSDAPGNFADSFRYASDPQSHGVAVVFDGSVIQGDRARKQRTQSFHAFESINVPELAKIQDGQIIRVKSDGTGMHSTAECGKPRFYRHLAADAAIVKLYPGMPGEILESYFHCCRGLVIEGFGMGGIPSYLMDTFTSCMERYKGSRMVVMATQVIWEGTDITCYEVGRRIAEESGVTECGDMTVEAALMKLMWLLGMGDEVQTDWKEKFRSGIQ